MHPEFLQQRRAGPSLWRNAIASRLVVYIPVCFVEQLKRMRYVVDGHGLEMVAGECVEEKVAFEGAPLSRLVGETRTDGDYGFIRRWVLDLSRDLWETPQNLKNSRSFNLREYSRSEPCSGCVALRTETPCTCQAGQNRSKYQASNNALMPLPTTLALSLRSLPSNVSVAPTSLALQTGALLYLSLWRRLWPSLSPHSKPSRSPLATPLPADSTTALGMSRSRYERRHRVHSVDDGDGDSIPGYSRHQGRPSSGSVSAPRQNHDPPL